MNAAKLAGLVCALALAAQAAGATDADTARKFGLIGTWAMDCSQPASMHNAYETISVASDGSIDAVMDMEVTGVDGLSHLHGLQLVDGGMVRLLWDSTVTHRKLAITIEKKANRQHSWKSVQADGKVLIDNGVFVASHLPAPWFAKCTAAR